MTAATLIAAVIGAIAAVVAAFFAFKGNEKLQQREHEFVRQEKSAGRCEELYEYFLDVVRGVDHPVRPIEPISDDAHHKLTLALIEVARNC